MEDAKWFIVHTYSGYEKKVADNIIRVAKNRNMEDEILDVCIPVERVTVAKSTSVTESNVDDSQAENDDKTDDKEVKVIERKIYPSYVMVKMGRSYDERAGEMKITDRAWYVVRNTRGVTGFVGPEGKPSPLSDEEVYSMGVEKKEIKVNYKVGSRVEIVDGPFEHQQGTVESIDLDAGTVTIIIYMMGRETDVDLELDQVEPVED